MIDPYQTITDRIIEQLERGVVPWHRPWNCGEAGMPRNLVSRKAYRGINVFLLATMPFERQHWLTFRQAKQIGGHVNKGEKGTGIVFWRWLEKENPETGKAERIPLLRLYTVFNVAQCTLPVEKLPPAPAAPANDVRPIDEADRIIAGMPTPPTIRHDATAAFYRPATDEVHMPRPERFESAEAYYATILHELTHATGHASRLNREGIAGADIRFGSATYSREELVAELGSAFLCGTAGIVDRTIEASASYVAGWLARLKSDKRLVVTAAAAAQKAADWILARRFDDADDDGQAD